MVGFCAKVKLLVIQLFVSLVLDYIPRLWHWLTCRSARGESQLRVFGTPAMKDLFQLRKLEGLQYPDPRIGGDTATIVCAFRPEQPVPYERVVDTGPDGNPICLDFFLAEEHACTLPILVLIIPGLASFSGTNYVQRLVWHYHAQGVHVCVMNARGLGDTPLVKPRLMSGAWTGDLRQLSLPGHALHRDSLEARCGVSEKGSLCIVGAGFSLGGVILTKFVGEEGQLSEAAQGGACGSQPSTAPAPLSIDALLVVNSPLDSVASSNVMRTRSFNKHFYDPNMAGGLVSYVRTHKSVLADLPGLSDPVRACFQADKFEDIFARIHSIYDYDLLINAGANGFDSPDEYYAAVSPTKWLQYVPTPIVCVNAADDPVIGPPPVERLCELTHTMRPNLAYVEVPYGGHLGYVKSPRGEWRQEPSFMEKLVADLVVAFASSRPSPSRCDGDDAHEPLHTATSTAVSFSEVEPEEALA